MLLSHSCVEYTIVDNAAVVNVFGRTPDNPKQRIRADFSDFVPFLYVKRELRSKLANDVRVRPISKKSAVAWANIKKDLVGTPVSYVETQIPKMVRDLRYELFVHKETFQADVLFDRNFLFCTKWKAAADLTHYEWTNKKQTRLSASIASIESAEIESILRLAYIDIETYHVPKSKSSVSDPREAITCASVFDSMGTEMYTLQWHPNTVERWADDRVYTFKTAPPKFPSSFNGKQYPWHLHFFTTEKAMLDFFVHVLSNVIDFDVGLSWNTNFDFAYIIARGNKIGVDTRRLSPLGKVFVSRNGDPVIAGRVIFDLYLSYRKLTIIGGQKKRYKLEFIAQAELGFGKLEYPYESTAECWMHDPKTHIFYNAMDVELIVRIDAEVGITENYNGLRTEFGLEFDDVLHPSSIIDADWIRSALARNICLPTKPPHPKDEKKKQKKFAGGYVFNATPGLQGVVVPLDAKTMYLNIIDMLNASPESILEKRVDADNRENLGNNIIAANGLVFRGDIESFSRECVRRYKSKRQEMKDKMVASREAGDKAAQKKWNRRQKSYKSISLSYYGVQGSIYSRLYNKDMAEAITLTGQYIIKWVAKLVEGKELRDLIKQKFGIDTRIKVVYGDTDSIFLSGFPPAEKVKEVICEVADFIGEYVTGKCIYFKERFNSDIQPIAIRSEKIYNGFYQTYTKEGGERKKTYVGNKWFEKQETAKGEYWEETNKLEIKGFEEKKSNTPNFAAKVQRIFLETIVRDCLVNMKAGFAKMQTHLRQTRYQFDQMMKDNKFEDVAQPTRISEPIWTYGKEKKDGTTGSVPKHVEGIIWLNKVLGTEYDVGETAYWLYVKKVPPGMPKTNVVAFVYPNEIANLGITIDWELMYKKHITDKLNDILAGLKITCGDILSGKRQKKVGDYWK